MERIYSAIFTNEKYNENEIELTAEALEIHNEKQELEEEFRFLAQPPPPPSSSTRTPSNLSYRPAEEILLKRKELYDRKINLSKELKDILKSTLRAFGYAYGAKAFTAVLLASRKWSTIEYGYADAVRLLLRLDTIRFGSFVGSLVGVFRVTELTSRLIRGKQDRHNLAIAGTVAGLTLFVDDKSRRSSISLYIFVRMLDIVGRRLTAEKILPQWKYSSEFLFALSNAFIIYAAVVDPSLLPKGYYNWIMKMGALNHLGLEYAVRASLRGEVDHFRRCQPHFHMESCTTHAIKEWFLGFGRAIQIYLPVHFLPAILFRFHKIRQSPIVSSAKISYAALCSSAFLTSYQTIVKLAICAPRNLLQKDHHLQYWIAGLISGLSLFFEDPKRRFELMLYCFPRALEILWQLLVSRKKPLLANKIQTILHGEILLFSLSLGLIMSSPTEHFKPTYLKVLRFVFGQRVI
jgi:hypothetical protein